MKKFRNKYRTESVRAKWWDYGRNGAYFITICTKNRECVFGEIENDGVRLLPLGVIANICWHEIPHHTKHVELGEFIVMPNHVHGIIMLNKPFNDNHADDDPEISIPNSVETLHATSLRNGDATSLRDGDLMPQQGKQMANISPKSNSISTIIRSYKSAVTKHARRLGFHFNWQSRFHDHIIRDEKSFQNISNYIIQNPMRWHEDRYRK